MGNNQADKTADETEGSKTNTDDAPVEIVNNISNSIEQMNNASDSSGTDSNGVALNSQENCDNQVRASAIKTSATTSAGLSSTIADTPSVDESTNSTTSPPNNSSGSNNKTSASSFTGSFTGNEAHRVHNMENLSKTNLYIKGLSANTTDQDLYSMCARFGSIFSTKAIQDKVNGGCRGYGFVQFTLPQAAETAVQELTKMNIQAQMARVSPGNSSHVHHNPHNNHYFNHNHHHGHQNQSNHNHNQHHHHHQHQHNNSNHHNGSNDSQSNSHNSSSSNSHGNNNNADPTNLYIANLPLTMNEIELENLLSSFGPVVSTRILREMITYNSRGVGFARMETKDKCQEIIDKLNGKPFRGSKEPLLVKFADGGMKKRHQHNNHHQSNNNNNNFQQHQKIGQDENRWRDNSSVMNNLSHYEQVAGNMAHNNQLPDLAIINTLGYPRLQPAFPPPVGPGGAYNPIGGPPTSGPHWIHPVAGQPWNMIPQQMIHPGNMNPSNQAAAAAAAAAASANFSFNHISQLTSQMQGLQLAHHPTHVGGYLQAQHQWPGMWPHPLHPQPQPQQQQQQQQQQAPPPPQPPQPAMRLATHIPLQHQQSQIQQKQPVQQAQHQTLDSHPPTTVQETVNHHKQQQQQRSVGASPDNKLQCGI